MTMTHSTTLKLLLFFKYINKLITMNLQKLPYIEIYMTIVVDTNILFINNMFENNFKMVKIYFR